MPAWDTHQSDPQLRYLSALENVLDVKPFWDDETAVGILLNHNYVHGMSGGAVVNDWGEMVGVIQQTYENIGYGVGTQLVKAFLLGIS